MKDTLCHTRSESSAILTSEKPFTTVGTSFEISIDFDSPQLGSQLSQIGLLLDNDKIQTALAPSAIRRMETSIGRPSTARDNSNAISHKNDPVCSSPVIRQSQDDVDLHEALRSQLPPFRQSNRWAKAYMTKDESVNIPKASTESCTPKEIDAPAHGVPGPSSSTSSQAADIVTISDNESEHWGLCGSTYVPGWHAIKRHRLLKRSAISMRVSSNTGARNLQSKRSTKSVQARIQTSPCRAPLPKTVKSKGSLREEQRLSQNTPKRVAKHGRRNSSPHSLISDVSEEMARVTTHHSTSPISSLHDYEKVKRFSQECVDMLSGLDFGDEWRLSIVAPELSISQKSSCNTLPSQAWPFGQIQPKFNADSTDNTRQDTKDVPELPLLPSSEMSGICRGVTAAELFKLASARLNGDQSMISPTNATKDKVKDCSPQQTFSPQAVSTKLGFSQQTAGDLTKNLKNARSIDTLTKIEAQVDDSPTRTRRLEKKGSSFTLASSPKRQRPAGAPPQRPLPDLPREDTPDNRSTVYHRPSSASNRRSRTIIETSDIVDPFRTDSTQTVIHLPFINVGRSEPMTASGSHDSTSGPWPKLGKESLGAGPSFSQEMKSPLNMDAQARVLKAKDAVNDRTMKVREMKKRDVATRSQDADNKSLKDKGDVTCALQPVDSGYESGRDGPQLSAQTCVKRITNHNFDLNKVISNTCRALNTASDATLSPILPTSEDRTKSTPRSSMSEEPARTASQASSVPRKVSPRYRKLSSASSLDRYQETEVVRKPNQFLAQSKIMVIVDTNPHTSSFRAGALSPSPSMVFSSSRPTSPAYMQPGGQTSRPPSASQAAPKTTSPVGSNTLADFVDIVKPPPSITKKRSPRNPRPWESTSQNFAANAARDKPDRTSSITISSRGRSRTSYHRLVSSDSELEDSPLLKNNQTAVQGNDCLKANAKKSHRRKNTPLTNMLKEEVRKADVELENLRRYEQRIEYLQLHLEQTLKVWSRMSQSGKKQYLASTFGVVERGDSNKSRLGGKYDEVTPIAANSTHSRSTSVQRLDDAVSRSLKDALSSVSKAANNNKRISSISTGTQTTDAGTDGSAESDFGSLGKRASGGSLTDPQDYDLPYSSSQRTSRSHDRDSQTGKTSIHSIGTNLDDLRARLQASRGPIIPTRRCKINTPPATSSTTTNKEVKQSVSPASNRYAIAPWEEHEETIRLSTEDRVRDAEIDRMSLQQEPLRTDQMDAMLAL